MSRLAFAWVHVRSELAQLVAAVSVIALGVGLAGGILLANDALLRSARASTAALAGRADLQVRTVSGGLLDETVLDPVRAVDGVAAAAPLLLGTASVEGAGERIGIVGVDLLDDATVRVYRSARSRSALDDPLLLLSQPDSALAPAALARARGLEIGDALTVDSPSGRKRLVVRGLLDDGDVSEAFGGAFLVMDLFAAQQLLAAGAGVSQVDVVVGGGTDAEEVQSRIRSALPPHVRVESIASSEGTLEKTVAGLALMLTAIGAIGLALGVLITANRLSTLYQKRAWEIGILRGMGYTPGRIMTDLLLEVTSFSALGTLLGLPLAYLLARLMVGPVVEMVSLSSAQVVGAPTVLPRPLPLAVAAGSGLVVGILAGLWPAFRATRSTVALLGARRRGRDPQPEGALLWWARIVVPVLALVALLTAGDSSARAAFAMLVVPIAGALLVRPLLHVVGWPIGWLFGPIAVAGLRDQSRAPSRPTGAARVLMVGIALVVWIATTGASFERFVVETNMSTRRGDLIVDGAVGVPATGENEPRLSDDVVAELAAMPEVAAVGAETYATSRDPEVGIVAVDAIRLRTPAFADWHLQPGARPDALESVASGDAVLADQNFVARNHLRIGDLVRVTSPNGELARPLAGITAPTFVSPAGDVVVARHVYRDAWRDPTVNRAFVMLTPGADASAVQRKIVATLGQRYRMRVTDMATHAGWIAASVRRGFAFSDAMAVITLIVVLIGTGDALAANTSERTREIGTLRAMGYPPRDVGKMVLAQALAVGIAGTLLAVTVGLAMSAPFVTGVLPAAVGWQLALYPSMQAVLGAALMGVVASAVGGLLPARHAARLPIATSLHYE